MAEVSYCWDGNVTGHAIYSPYGYNTAPEMFMPGIFSLDNVMGVIPNYANKLEVTQVSSSMVSVATGAAMVYRQYYENTTPVLLTVNLPGSGVFYYSVVLQVVYATRKARLQVLGPSLVGYPALTQDASIFEIPIANIDVAPSGITTVTRTARYLRSMGTNLLQVRNRQGGSATVWSTAGTNNYALTTGIRMAVGNAYFYKNADPYTHIITFPLTFDYNPIVIATAGATGVIARLSAVTTTTATLELRGGAAGGTYTTLYWFVIGQKAAG